MTAIAKTGGWCFLAEYGTFVYGDIYHSKITGAIWVRVINNVEGNFQRPLKKVGDPSVIWATLDRVENDYIDNNMKTIIGAGRMHWEWSMIGGGVDPVPTDFPLNI